jgi:hypothetical protein
MKIAKDAEKLATDAEDSAKYHRLRAKEMEGRRCALLRMSRPALQGGRPG